uniref:Uncharacterized protein n=1 Tax=Rhizophora mucronata TaxID=61149 RepID=A0A2P2PQG6_RHIMU
MCEFRVAILLYRIFMKFFEWYFKLEVTVDIDILISPWTLCYFIFQVYGIYLCKAFCITFLIHIAVHAVPHCSRF